MMRDDIVGEIHAHRSAVSDRFGGDLARMLEYYESLDAPIPVRQSPRCAVSRKGSGGRNRWRPKATDRLEDHLDLFITLLVLPSERLDLCASSRCVLIREEGKMGLTPRHLIVGKVGGEHAMVDTIPLSQASTASPAWAAPVSPGPHRPRLRARRDRRGDRTGLPFPPCLLSHRPLVEAWRRPAKEQALLSENASQWCRPGFANIFYPRVESP